MLRFDQNTLPQLEFQTAVKRPIPIRCAQIPEPFEVKTLEGIMKGKAGDWLMIGIDGEKYVCDQDIFKRSYQLKKN
ncbi:hypothetical protein ACFQO1_05845 [Jejudonia soesokkakensis]|uniref:Uncharacterized protein n=1 Tax=Jejudonia soesokkakensis TaxID=1323432 RepID=A0ABW2MV21_9FLAO